MAGYTSLNDALKRAFPMEALLDPTRMRRNRPELFRDCRGLPISRGRWMESGDESGMCVAESCESTRWTWTECARDWRACQ